MVEPLNNDDLDKIFGTEAPDFTGEGGTPEEMVECCHYHFLGWLKDVIEAGQAGNLSPEQVEKTLHHLSGAQQVLYQVQDEEDADAGKVLEEAGLGTLGKLLGKALDGVIMEADTGDAKLQILADGMRIRSGGKSVKVTPLDSVLIAGTIGGWIWPSKKMRDMFLARIREIKEQVEEEEGNL